MLEILKMEVLQTLRLESGLALNRKNDKDVTICRNDVIVKLFDVVLFLLLSLVTGASFMTILSSLVLELCFFIRD